MLCFDFVILRNFPERLGEPERDYESLKWKPDATPESPDPKNEPV